MKLLPFLYSLLCALVLFGCPDTASETCGDGVLQGGEQCEGEDLGGVSCSDVIGYPTTGSLACGDDCMLDVRGCCGDGVVFGVEEACDDGNRDNSDGCARCDVFFPDDLCGNGTLDKPEEQCDDGNNIDGDGCDGFCLLEEGDSTCGNGTLEFGEKCDDGNTVSGDGCSDNCRCDTVITPAGGTSTSDDGKLAIIFPAGGVSSNAEVCVNASGPDPALAALSSGEDFIIESFGLTISAPFTMVIELPGGADNTVGSLIAVDANAALVVPSVVASGDTSSIEIRALFTVTAMPRAVSTIGTGLFLEASPQLFVRPVGSSFAMPTDLRYRPNADTIGLIEARPVGLRVSSMDDEVVAHVPTFGTSDYITGSNLRVHIKPSPTWKCESEVILADLMVEVPINLTADLIPGTQELTLRLSSEATCEDVASRTTDLALPTALQDVSPLPNGFAGINDGQRYVAAVTSGGVWVVDSHDGAIFVNYPFDDVQLPSPATLGGTPGVLRSIVVQGESYVAAGVLGSASPSAALKIDSAPSFGSGFDFYAVPLASDGDMYLVDRNNRPVAGVIDRGGPLDPGSLAEVDLITLSSQDVTPALAAGEFVVDADDQAALIGGIPRVVFTQGASFSLPAEGLSISCDLVGRCLVPLADGNMAYVSDPGGISLLSLPTVTPIVTATDLSLDSGAAGWVGVPGKLASFKVNGNALEAYELLGTDLSNGDPSGCGSIGSVTLLGTGTTARLVVHCDASRLMTLSTSIGNLILPPPICEVAGVLPAANQVTAWMGRAVEDALGAMCAYDGCGNILNPSNLYLPLNTIPFYGGSDTVLLNLPSPVGQEMDISIQRVPFVSSDNGQCPAVPDPPTNYGTTSYVPALDLTRGTPILWWAGAKLDPNTSMPMAVCGLGRNEVCPQSRWPRVHAFYDECGSLPGDAAVRLRFLNLSPAHDVVRVVFYEPASQVETPAWNSVAYGEATAYSDFQREFPSDTAYFRSVRVYDVNNTLLAERNTVGPTPPQNSSAQLFYFNTCGTLVYNGKANSAPHYHVEQPPLASPWYSNQPMPALSCGRSCTSSEVSLSRCCGNTVETCDGTSWSTNQSCGGTCSHAAGTAICI